MGIRDWLNFMFILTGILLAVTLWFLLVPILIAMGTVFVAFVLAKLYKEDRDQVS
jgi:hypothetical protein